MNRACRSQVSVLSPQNWSVDDVADYIKEVGFERESELFRAVKVNGKLLMSFNRNQIVNELGLKLGPAIKLYAYIHDLQEKNRSPDHATSK